MRDAGNLLTRAGFTLPGVDVDEYVVRYPSGEHSLIYLTVWPLVEILMLLNLLTKAPLIYQLPSDGSYVHAYISILLSAFCHMSST